ncbi:hypothetical protein CR162_14320 [Pseudoroseomonas rhizosphaerae]|uniref:Uncharacterized protein n=2 Tax=Teichococcus rhizosphaerae TaxID=1335062 RepID=A0A2C6Z717_9PROT|nr:hypothetical protein CR162_14320 [Pseudoroseomonas rhizosphaerae]
MGPAGAALGEKGHRMCGIGVSGEAGRLSAAEIAAITTGLRSLPEPWSLFPSVGCEGEVTLMATPAWADEAGSGEDWAVLMQGAPGGIRLLLSAGEALDEIGVAPGPEAAIRLAREAARRHRAGLERPGGCRAA